MPEENITYDYKKLEFNKETGQALRKVVVLENGQYKATQIPFNGIAYVFTNPWEGSLYKEKIHFRNGYKDGVSLEYYSNDRSPIKNKSYYKNGKKDGIFESYDETGKLMVKVLYKNDKVYKKIK